MNGTAVNSTTIGLMRRHYGIPNGAGSPHVAAWFLTPSDNSHSAADLATFQALYGLNATSVSTACANSKGQCDGSLDPDGLEANLDAQYLSGSSPLSHTLEQTFDELENDDCHGPECWLGDLVECATDACGSVGSLSTCSYDPCFGKPPPSVISISWGVPEIDLPPAQAIIFNQHAVHLALLGVTLVAASGDGGAAGIYPGVGGENAYHQICGNTYQPLFPAASPYVTSVGATQGVETGSAESGCSAGAGGGITTGGGFSALKYPSGVNPWQQQHVSAYLNSAAGKAAAEGYFLQQSNGHWMDSGYSYEGGLSTTQRLADHIKTHRAYPDLALAGAAVQMVNGGKVVLIDGTSASAPLFAAMVANVVGHRRAVGPASWRSGDGTIVTNGNDALERASSSDERGVTSANVTRSYRLGWLNPTLYAHAAAFNDITEGANTDGRGTTCPTDPSVYTETAEMANDEQYKENGEWQSVFLSKAAGFSAGVGWDPVTGLGSIKYEALRGMFPVAVATSSGTGDLGSDYYDAESQENAAEDFTEQHSVPSPPAASYEG